MKTIRSLFTRRMSNLIRRKPRTVTRLVVERLESRDNPAPVPTVSLSVTADPFIGEQNLPVSVTFTNPTAGGATQPGFGPWTYVVLPRSGDTGNAANDGISYVAGSATYLGAAITGTVFTATGSTLTPTGAVAAYALNPAGNPIQITGLTAGDQVVFFQLPYISFAQDQPNATVRFLTNVSNQATLNAPLNLRAGGGFTLGTDALNNPVPDPPLVATAVQQTVRPELIRLRKTYIGPEQETATGPNYTRQYRIDAFVAPGQTITSFQLRDLLDAGMQYRPDIPVVTTVNGGTFLNTTGTTATAATPGGTVVGNFSQVTGDASAASVDASMTFSFFVPRNNAGGTNVVPLGTGAFQTLTDQAGASGSWTPIDTLDASITPASAYWADPLRNPTDTITAKSVAVQKGVSVVGGNGLPQQGAVLEYAIDFQISDYFAFDQLNIPDLLPDGVRFDGTFTPTLSLNGGAAGNFAGGNFAVGGVNVDGTQSLNFNVSAQAGGAGRFIGGWIPNGGTGGAVPDTSPFGNALNPPGGPTIGRIVFRAVIQNTYSNLSPPNNNVKQGDTLTNLVPTATPAGLPGGTQPAGGRVLDYADAATPVDQRADSTAASVTIRTGTLTKTIYAVNGVLVPGGSTPRLQNGDVVTYRLTYVLPTSSAQNFRITDYLPLPVFNATTVSANFGVARGTMPAAGTANYGDGSGAPGGAVQYGDGTIGGQSSPTVVTNGTANTVQFVFPSILQDNAQRTSFIDILFSVTITDNAYADGFPLTNQANAREGNTTDAPTEGDQINQVLIGRPNLVVIKGVVGTDRTGFGPFGNGGGTFGGPGAATSFTGTINSNGLTSSPINSNLSGIDAGDRVQFAVVVQNTGTGHRGAYDVVVNDTIPTGLSAPPAGLNLQIRDGTGAGGNVTAAIAAGYLFFDSSNNPLTTQGQVEAAFFSVGGVRISGGPTAAQADGTNGGVIDPFDATNGRNVLVITYDLRTNDTTQGNTVRPNQALVNTGTVTQYLAQTGGINQTPTNVGSLTDPATVTIALPLVAKTLVGTEFTAPGNNAANQAVVGEYATYTVTVTVPEGSTLAAALVDTLDAGLAFVDVTGVTASGSLSSSLGTIDLATIIVNLSVSAVGGQNGRRITFNLGDITNTNLDNTAAETITITYRAVVLNTIANQSGQTRNNSAQFQWTSNTNTLPGVPAGRATNTSGTLTGTAMPVTIVEPTVTPAKTVRNVSDNVPAGAGNFAERVRADAGDDIRYQIVLTASGTTAYDLTLSDPLPVQFTGASVPIAAVITGTVRRNGVVVTTLATTDFDLTSVPGTLQFAAGLDIDMESGATLTVVVDGTWTGASGNVITNTAQVRWTSLDGTPGQRSTHNTDSVERGGQDGLLGGGTVNDYRTQDGAQVESPTIVRKAVVATSEPGTAGSNVTIGEVVRHRLYVSLPEGTSANFQVRDFLPPGLRFLNDGSARFAFISTGGASITSATAGSIVGVTGGGLDGSTALLLALASGSITGTFGDSNLSPTSGGAGTGDPALYASGGDVFFRFANMTNADDDLDIEYLVIEYNALVENVVGNQAGTTLDNNFGVLIDLNADGTPGYIDVVVDANADGTGSGEPTVAAADPTNDGTGTPALSNTTTLTVVEPSVQINKQVIATTGGTVMYRLTVTNTGANASQGNDVRIFDALNAANLTLVNPAGLTATLSGGASGATNNSAGNTVDFTITVIPVGGQVVIEYTVNVLTTPTGTTTIDNTANATATSLTGDNGFTGNFFGTLTATLGTPGTSTGERTGAGGINDYAVSDTERLGSLGDRVYFDADGDGVQDAGEPGIVGVPVTVTWFGLDGVLGGGDDSVIVTNAGANGNWTVTGLPVGAGQNYRVSVPIAFSSMDVTDAVDNGVLTASNTADIALTGVDAATTNNRVQDFGYRGTASLGNRVYLDVDGDGVQDANGLEPSLPGVTVTLEWAGADGNLATAADNLTFTTVSTPAAGTGPNYLFPNLPSGNFRVTVSATGGTGGVPDNTSLTDSVDDGTLTATGIVTTSLTTGQNRTDQDFGYHGTASLGNRVYYDADADGVQDAGEPGIAGATVTLVWAGPNGTLGNADDVTFTTTTDANGNYLFPGLPVNGATDDFRVTVTPAAAFPTLTDSLDNGGAPSATNPVVVPLAQAENRMDVDFGYRGTAQLGNLVWEDLNANGRQDGGLEAGIDGVTVNLYFDANNNGTFEAGELAAPLLTTTTAGGGLYAFTNLAAGNYRAQFGTLAGYTRTTADSPIATDATDSDANAATGFTGDYTLALGGTDQTVDAGLYRPVSLGDRVYVDQDGDGVQDATEPGISGVGITVVWLGPDGVAGGGDDQTFTTTTGANGAWIVTNLPPGNFTVTATPIAGITVLTDSLDDAILSATNPVGVSTPSGVNRTDVDFGFRGTASLGDRVYHDQNGDGIQQAGERGIPNATVTVVWHGQNGTIGGGDDLTVTTTTDANGNYTVGGLPDGNYTVTVNTATLPDNFTSTDNLDDGVLTPGSTVIVPLAVGQNRTDVDFGCRGTASIGDRVWYDVDGDGIQDNSAADGFEPGIAGVTVTLLFGGDDGDLTTAADNITYTTTTDATGSYLFAGLFGGDYANGVAPNYRVTVNQPAGYAVQTFDADGLGTANQTETRLDDGETDLDQDFGYRGAATQGLGNFVWDDLNGNGRQDGGEPGIVGVQVELLDAAGTVLDVTTTAAGGLYSFPNLAASATFGDYRVRFTAPAGFVFTVPTSAVATTTTDSNPNAATGTTANITLPANTIDDTIDAGLYVPISLGDRVYFDADADGVQDGGEPGLAGVGIGVVWHGPDGVAGGGDDQTFNTTTGANGAWTVTNLPPGNFTVTASPTPASGLNTLTDSLDDGVLTATNPVVVSTPSGVNRTDVDFGYVGTASLGDRVWWDVDSDGVQDAGEPGLAGIPVTLTWFGIDGVLGGGDDLVLTTTTGPNGAYTFPNLPAGNFRVDVSTAGTNLTATYDLDGTGTPNSAITPLTSGQTRTDVDFGLVGNATLGDRVYIDQNRDGIQQPTEPGIPNATLQLTGAGFDGTLGTADDFTFTTTTAANGTYLFTGLPVYGGSDDYRIEVTALPSAGLNLTDSLDDGVLNPANPVVVPVTDAGANQNRRDVDFGYDGVSTLSGTVYHDANNNDVLDAGDVGIPGATLTLIGTDLFGNPVLDPLTGLPYLVTTDGNGNYTFGTVVPGTYRVVETQPGGYLDNPDTAGSNGGDTSTNDTIAAIPVGPSQVLTGYNFGEILPASVNGTVYEDRNRNSTHEPFEPGIRNVVVTLTGTDDRGNPVSLTTTTDANGNYTFPNLRPGTYTLTQRQPAGYSQGGNAVGSAGGQLAPTDVIRTIVLGQGQNGLNYLFGEVRLPDAVPAIAVPAYNPSKNQFLSSTNGLVPTVPSYTALGSLSQTAPVQFVVTADGAGGRHVRVFDVTNGNERFRFTPFPGFTGGARAAVGDVTGDGIPDIVVGAGPGGGPQVLVYDGNTGAVVHSFFAFEWFFPGGVFVATGDFNSDGMEDVVVSADKGGGPRVRVFSGGDPNLVLADFWGIDDPNFRGGARVATGDIDADGVPDLVVAAGSGGGPRVAGYNGAGIAVGQPNRLFGDFFAFEPFLSNGAYVAVGDVDGDGFGDVITGAGEGGAPRVTAFSGQSLLNGGYDWVSNFFAFAPTNGGGVRVSAIDLNQDGRVELFVGAGPDQLPRARFIDPRTGQLLDEFAADWTNAARGVFVG